jgi:rRNA-processing protein EBP2
MADPEESDYSGTSDSEEENSSSDEEEQHEKPLKEPRKDAVYNTDGLREKLEEIGWPEDLEWTQTLAITYPDTGTVVDVDDDLQREMSFYTQVSDCLLTCCRATFLV